MSQGDEWLDREMPTMLKSFHAEGINGRLSVSCAFYPDLNVVTGRNGSGKTTLLKTLWYLVSGNLERIPSEINFTALKLITSDFELKIESRRTNPPDPKADTQRARVRFRTRNERMYKIDFQPSGGGEQVKIDIPHREFAEESAEIRELNHRIALGRNSVFFPTFRRIEGGFSLISGREVVSGLPHGYTRNIARELDGISERLGVLGHKFVCSISTEDVVTLLTRRYADLSQETNKAHGQLVAKIMDAIGETAAGKGRRGESEKRQLSTAKDTIQQIRTLAAEFKQRQENLLLPFTALSSFIDLVMKQKGITITPNIILGEGNEKIPSDLLSAGEKQILGFLVYNAFYSGVPIFIDEPELSLHVDWQRILFPTLLKQQTTNQFIIATHSPFIYSKYADREIVLEETRGE